MFMKANAQCTPYSTGSTYTTALVDVGNTASLTSYSYGSGIYYVNGDLEIAGDVTFTDAVLVMYSNSKITVKTTGNLTLVGCHLFACNDMWQGIVIE